MKVDIDGTVLYTLRKDKKVSQAFLAELLKCTRQTISNIEIGKTPQTDEENVRELAKFFDISPEILQGKKDTPQEQAFYESRKVILAFLTRLQFGELRETDLDVVLSIAEFFGVNKEEAEAILDENGCMVKIHDRKKTVLESPLIRGNYRGQISCKFNQLTDSRLPSVGRILDYINACDMDQLHLLEKHCEVSKSHTTPNPPLYKSTNEYIYHLITEYETPTFWESVKKELTNYSFNKSPEELKALKNVINNDLGYLRFKTLQAFITAFKKWNS